jgi:Protein of unknown function (DUF3987)
MPKLSYPGERPAMNLTAPSSVIQFRSQTWSGDKFPFEAIIEAVAIRLLGEPNHRMSKPPKTLRFGTHGSMSIDTESGLFFDHEAKVGGGVIKLVIHKQGGNHDTAVDWLRREGFLPDRKPSKPPRPSNGASTHTSDSHEAKAKVADEPEAEAEPEPQIEHAYDYVDKNGALLFQVVRYSPKTFKQRRPGERPGEWIWSLDGIRRVLYRLPELIEAVGCGKTIFITEGEKDSDNLVSIGFTAATNAGGSGKWLPEYNEHLRGADVVIVPHNDDAGRDHATKVATALAGIAQRIRVLDLPNIWPECGHKQDISDWIAAGGDAAKLKAAIDALSAWTPSTASPNESDAWPILDDAAYHGLVGEIVRLIEPHTEADPVGILIQVLATFGNIVGNSPYYLVESDKHHANLFAVLVGTSSKGRKGTSGGRVRAITKDADEFWAIERCASGLSSGEGIINAVRDELKRWNSKDRCEETVDRGVKDKRLMITEPEFAGTLAVMERPGNTLSPVIRNAWDGHRLQTLAKSAGQVATGSHISIIAHITETEARSRLTRTDMANGFANRFLFCCVKRSKHLPHGGNLDDAMLAEVAKRFKEAVDFAKCVGKVTMTETAARVWEEVYPELSAERPGLIGAVIARSEAQAIRLALIFALMDKQTFIDVAHLRAAISLWTYAEQSAIRIFGDSLGDPIADEILRALRQSPNGMTRTDIRNLFSRHGTAGHFDAALKRLFAAGKAKFEVKQTGGRPVETWFAIGGTR